MKKILTLLIVTLALVACGGNAQKEKKAEGLTSLTDINAVENTSNRVNVITQALPSIMVIPSDQCL